MDSDDPNPFLAMHKEDAIKAWRLETSGTHAWEADASHIDVKPDPTTKDTTKI